MNEKGNSDDSFKQIELLKNKIAHLEQELSQSEKLFRALTDSAPVGIYLDDADGKAIYINKKCAELVGAPAEAALNFNWIPYLHPDDRNAMVKEWEKSFKNGSEFHMEYRWLHADGKIIWTLGEVMPIRDEDGKVKMYIGALTDITDRKTAEQEMRALERQLLQAQKLESIGRLAGGVAHDFNNMLSTIMCYSELALDEVDEASPAHRMLREILKAANRSAEVTKQLLSFARKQIIMPTVFDVSNAVSDLLSMLRPLIGETIALEWDPPAEPLPIKMDRSQFDQIIVNLCINARDAISESGVISLSAKEVILDDKSELVRAGGSAGKYVVFIVQDNGCGMDQATTKNMFEPFFTTKDNYKGTGLGLASVYGAVKQNDGFIDVHSEPGKGTTLSLYFPHQENIPSLQRKSTPIPTRQGKGEVILLVEDEASILEVLSEILVDTGFRVLAAKSTAQALDLARNEHKPISLLITDIIMPDNNGRDLANQLRQRFPSLKCLYMSGYTADIIAKHGVLEDGLHFIQKPFQVADMIEKINLLLHEK